MVSSTEAPSDIQPEGMGGVAMRDMTACRSLIRQGSRSFYLASRLLPSRVGIPATALYAFCRVADDLIDTGESTAGSVKTLTARLDAIYAGQPCPLAEDRAMAEVVHHFSIPRTLPDALIEGLTWDTQGRHYDSLSDLYRYAARVAGSVGAMMSLIMHTRDARAMARACDLGVAMQLTNIARDVGEDARMGRLYLPRQWFHECGLDPDAWLADPRLDRHITGMRQRLIAHADTLYRRADTGIALLPAGCRPGIRAARLIYADIGREIARQGSAPLEYRAIVPTWRKLLLAASAVLPVIGGARVKDPDRLEWPMLAESAFLLSDVDTIDHQPRSEWLIDLFIDLGQRQRLEKRVG